MTGIKGKKLFEVGEAAIQNLKAFHDFSFCNHFWFLTCRYECCWKN